MHQRFYLVLLHSSAIYFDPAFAPLLGAFERPRYEQPVAVKVLKARPKNVQSLQGKIEDQMIFKGQIARENRSKLESPLSNSEKLSYGELTRLSRIIE